MPSISVKEAFALLTANAGTDGWCSVANEAPFYPGATAYISSTAVAGTKCKITDVDSVGHRVRLRPVTTANGSVVYTFSDLSAYTLAQSASIYMESGVVRLGAPSTIVKSDHVD